MEPELFNQYASVLNNLATSTSLEATGDASGARTAELAAQQTISDISSAKIATLLRDHNKEIAAANQELFAGI